MIIQTKIGVICQSDEAKATIFLKEAIECPTCKRAVMILINEGGSTRCTTCPEPK